MMHKALPYCLYILIFTLKSSGISVDLVQAESMALSSSLELEQAEEQMALAVLSRRLEIRDLLPGISVSYSDSYQRTFHGPDSEALRFALEVTQPIFNGGRNVRARKLSALQLELLAATLETGIETVRDQVWQIFHQLLIHREKLNLQNELYGISRDQLKITQHRMELGSITETDYLDALIRLKDMEIQVLETESREKELKREFLHILGLDTVQGNHEELVLLGNLDRDYAGLPLYEKSHRAFEETALGQNRDLRSQEASVLQARTQCELLRTAFLPVVNAEMTLSFDGERLPMQNPGYSARIVISFPFDPLPVSGTAGRGSRGETTRNRSFTGEIALLPDIGFVANQRSAEVQLKQEIASLERMKKDITYKISTHLETLEQKRLRLNLIRENQDLQKKKLDILRARNQLGEVAELDILEAGTDYYEGEITLREYILDLLASERELECLLGLPPGDLKYLCPENTDE